MNSFSKIIAKTIFYLIIFHHIFVLRQPMMLEFIFILICFGRLNIFHTILQTFTNMHTFTAVMFVWVQ